MSKLGEFLEVELDATLGSNECAADGSERITSAAQTPDHLTGELFVGGQSHYGVHLVRFEGAMSERAE